jgi:lysophospholipase L1-like esterase
MKLTKKRMLLTALFFVNFSILLSIGELGMRLRCFFHLAPATDEMYTSDTVLPFKMKPFLKLYVRSETGEFAHHIETNSFGFRDVEHACKKNDNTFRILALGDSMTLGGGAERDETYPYILETMLNKTAEKHKKVEIINAGIPRYFPEPERLLLEHYGKKYAPDLILINFMPNDISDTHLGIDAVIVDQSGLLTVQEAAYLGRIGVFLYTKSYLCRYVLKNYISHRVSQQNKALGNWNEIYKPNGFYEKDWQTVELEYQKMVNIAAELKAPIVFIHIPQKGPWNESNFYPAQRLAAFAIKHKAGFIDILPGMIEASANKVLYYEKEGHCTPQGYMIIAQQVYKYIIKNKFLPPQ